MYSTYIQIIEIALLSDPWCIQLTLNTDSRHSNTDKYSLTICTYKLYRYTNEDIVEKKEIDKVKWHNCADASSARKRTVFYQTVRSGRLQTMLDEVEIIPVLHKVTGAGHSCKGGGRTWGCGHWGGGGGCSVRVQGCVG